MIALIVDDEAHVRALVSRILELHGHKAIEAADGTEALRLSAKHDCDLIITDLAMPGMSGLELVTRLQASQCRARYLLISGYGQAMRRDSDLPFLAKPFTVDQLITAVESVAGKRLPARVRAAGESGSPVG